MSFPTYFLDDPAVVLRQPEVPLASFADGMNAGGSNAPGIGINYTDPATAVVGSVEQFTLLDQFEEARDPQVSQMIGGSAYTDPAGWPSSGGDEGQQPKDVIRVADGDLLTGDGDTAAAALGNASLPDLSGWTLYVAP